MYFEFIIMRVPAVTVTDVTAVALGTVATVRAYVAPGYCHA